LDLLFSRLADACADKLSPQDYAPAEKFRDTITFVIHRHPEGDETIVVEPYFLKSKRKFGLLLDYRFRPEHGVRLTKRIQQLSLSLDAHFKSNRNAYLDRYEKISRFLARYSSLLFPVHLEEGGSRISLAEALLPISGDRLRAKRYVFRHEKKSFSPFNGIKNHGPLCAANPDSRLSFVYREEDRAFAQVSGGT